MNPQRIDSHLYVKTPHAAIVCGMPESGKTRFVLELLEDPFRGVFKHIVFVCPDIAYNKTYSKRAWIWSDPEVYLIEPGKHLLEWLQLLFQYFQGEQTLYVVDDMTADQQLSKRKTMLSELATRGRHPNQSLWILTHHYTGVALEVRRQTKWTAMFFCKDRDSFAKVCRENDVIPTPEERARVKQHLASVKHSKVILRTEIPTAYKVFG